MLARQLGLKTKTVDQNALTNTIQLSVKRNMFRVAGLAIIALVGLRPTVNEARSQQYVSTFSALSSAVQSSEVNVIVDSSITFVRARHNARS